MLEYTVFAVLALFMIGGSLAMLWNKQTIFGAFGFLVAMLGLAGMFALLDNSFLFLAQILVSVGAVVVLSLMVIVSVNAKDENLPKEPGKLRWILFSAVLTVPFALLMYRSLMHVANRFGSTEAEYGTLKSMGEQLFSEWVLPFEIVSILLLAAMIGAIVIARKEKAQ